MSNLLCLKDASLCSSVCAACKWDTETKSCTPDVNEETTEAKAYMEADTISDECSSLHQSPDGSYHNLGCGEGMSCCYHRTTLALGFDSQRAANYSTAM
jgi:hypothetical protein